MIPIHPQPCPGHPDRLRWITPTGALPFTGPVAEAPAPLAALLHDNTLADITLEPNALVTRLGEHRNWHTDGPRVRTAIHAALDEPAGWTPAGETTSCDDDAILFAAAQQLINGPVGQYARSHGGRIDLLGAHDGVVTVRLAGACHGCPAARVTLHQRLESLLRLQYPRLRAVADTGIQRPRDPSPSHEPSRPGRKVLP